MTDNPCIKQFRNVFSGMMYSVYIVFGKLETFLEKENVAMLGSTIGTMKHHRIGKKLINPRLGHNTTLCCTMKHHRIGKKLLNPRLGHNTTLCCLTKSDQVPCSIYIRFRRQQTPRWEGMVLSVCFRKTVWDTLTKERQYCAECSWIL